MRAKILLGLLVVILGGMGFLKLNKDFLLLWNVNSIHVTTAGLLRKENVKIRFGISVNSINRSTDTELFKKMDKYAVLYDGKRQNELINEYGENDFLITYNDKYYFSFRQFKLNRRHQHDYNFHFYQKDNKIIIQADIKGQDALKVEQPMIEIASARQHRFNLPI